MHIHLPKPLHGWREFVGEVGIIVLGILIALAAEQAIEHVHWSHKAEQATAALRKAAENNSLFAIEQQVTGPCIDRQLTEIETRLAAPGRFTPASIYREKFGFEVPFTVRIPSRPWNDGTWRIITGEGVATHLPAATRERMDYIYAALTELEDHTKLAEPVAWRLNSLSSPLAAEPAARARLMQDIEELRGREALMRLIAGQVLGSFKELGMMPSASIIRTFIAGESGTIAFCRDHHLPMDPIRPIAAH